MANILTKIHTELDHTISSIFHILAMYLPNIHLKRFFYKIRGTKMGKHVDIAPMVFLEEAYPGLITIRDNADLGPGVIVVTHDSSLRCVSPGAPVITEQVLIGRNVYIGAGAIILPGVTIGDNSIIGAGAVVTRDIPANSVAFGIPARVVCTVDEWKNRKS